MLASVSNKLPILIAYCSKELFLSRIKAQCGVLGLPLNGDSQIRAPFIVPLCPLQHVAPADDQALCSLHPLKGEKSMELHVGILQGPYHISSHSIG